MQTINPCCHKSFFSYKELFFLKLFFSTIKINKILKLKKIFKYLSETNCYNALIIQLRLYTIIESNCQSIKKRIAELNDAARIILIPLNNNKKIIFKN